jgi:hypothetical protein
MSSCDESNITKNYIVQSPGDIDILSACTAFYTNNIYNCTGDTLTLHSSIVSANTINATTYLSGGTNILDILVSLDNFTTSAALIDTTVYFNRTDSLSAYTLDLSSLDVNDTFVTGFTYDNANTFTISDNSGTTFNATFNTVTGLTVNGGLSATTVSACTGIYTSNLYGCSPITVHDNIQSVSSEATGTTSFAFGFNTKAYGNFSHAEGSFTIASGDNSHAEGIDGTTASGEASHAEGTGTLASAQNSHAEGAATVASGDTSHAEGSLTIASGIYSHAEGRSTLAGGESSHAEGENTTASGFTSHAEGYYTTASGDNSHAEGHGGIASGAASHAGGMGARPSAGNTIIASGNTSFVHFSQLSFSGYKGAYGDYSAILGGNDHNIDTGSTSSGIFVGSDNIIDNDVLRSVILGGSNITGTTSDTVYVPNLNIGTAPLDNTLTQILSRDSSDGTIRYRDVASIISAATSQDTYVTGFTYDDANTFTISDNSGSTFSSTINTVTGLTVNGTLSATTLDGGTILSGGTNLLTIIDDRDNYVTGTTFGSNQSVTTTRDGVDVLKISGGTNVTITSGGTNLSVIDVTIPTDNNTFITAFTYDDINAFTITDNLGTAFTASINILSATTISATTFYGDGSNLSGITHTTDTFVSGGTYNEPTKEIKFSGNSVQTTFEVDLTSLVSSISGDTFISSFDYSPNTLTITRNDGTGFTANISEFSAITVTGLTVNSDAQFNDNVTVDGNTLIKGNVTILGTATTINSETVLIKDNILTLNSNATGTTAPFPVDSGLEILRNSATTSTLLWEESNQYWAAGLSGSTSKIILEGDSLSLLVSGHTHPIGEIIGLQSALDTKVSGATNLSPTGIFAQKTGQNLEFKGITSTGATVTITNDSTRVNLEVTIPTDDNTFITAFTYDDINAFTITDNLGTAFTASINVLSATTISATTFYGDGSNLSGITHTTDTFVTGGTYNTGTVNLDFSGNTGFSPFSVNVSALKDDTNIYVTGNTYTAATDNTNQSSLHLLYQGTPVGGPYSLSSEDTYITGTTFGSNQAILRRNDGTSVFELSGSSSVQLTNPSGNKIDIDVTIPPGMNTYMTAFTYDDINAFTITDNLGTAFTASINVLSATTISGGTFYGDGSNLSGISDDNTTITAFTYDSANTFTISDSSGTTFDASINIMTGLTINGESTGTTLTVNGQSVFSGTSTDVVQIYGSGSTSPIFRIQGSSGELFSVTDSLIGELFAVNNISGIPILQVYSDNRIILGDNVAPSLYTTAKVTANSGMTTNIYSVSVSAYTGAWFEYTAKGTTSLRAGNIASIFSGTSINHNETTTIDIGDTSDLLLDVIISGTNATLTASATTSNWEIKTIIRSI